jgi:hypothetical protein
MQRKLQRQVTRKRPPPLTPEQLERTPEDRAQDRALLERLNRQRAKPR